MPHSVDTKYQALGRAFDAIEVLKHTQSRGAAAWLYNWTLSDRRQLRAAYAPQVGGAESCHRDERARAWWDE